MVSTSHTLASCSALLCSGSGVSGEEAQPNNCFAELGLLRTMKAVQAAARNFLHVCSTNIRKFSVSMVRLAKMPRSSAIPAGGLSNRWGKKSSVVELEGQTDIRFLAITRPRGNASPEYRLRLEIRRVSSIRKDRPKSRCLAFVDLLLETCLQLLLLFSQLLYLGFEKVELPYRIISHLLKHSTRARSTPWIFFMLEYTF